MKNNSDSHAPFLLDDWRVEPATGTLSREGEQQRLPRQTVALLLYLADHAGDVVSIDELLEEVWPDRFTTDESIYQHIRRLRKALRDDPRAPHYIETVPTQGYRLIASVLEEDHQRQKRLALASTPTITVPAIESLTGEPVYSAFARVAAEDLIAELARRDGVRVLQTEQASAQPAEYRLEGYIRESTESAVLTIKLINQADGEVIWPFELEISADTSRFDKAPYVARLAAGLMRNRFQITNVLPPGLDSRARTALLAGMDGWWRLHSGSGGNWRTLDRHFARAIELEPRLFLAYFYRSVLYVNRFGNSILWQDAEGPAHRLAEEGTRLFPDHTNIAAQVAYMIDLDYARSLMLYDRGADQSAGVEAHRGNIMLLQGRPEAAIPFYRSALSMGGGPDEAFIHLWLGWSQMLMGRYTDAGRSFDAGANRSDGFGEGDLDLRVMKIQAHHLDNEFNAAARTLGETLDLHGSKVAEEFPVAFAWGGQPEAAAESLADLDAQANTEELTYFSPLFRASHALGRTERALFWLSKAIDNREIWLFPDIKAGSQFDDLRQTEAFRDIMSRLAAMETPGTANLVTPLADRPL